MSGPFLAIAPGMNTIKATARYFLRNNPIWPPLSGLSGLLRRSAAPAPSGAGRLAPVGLALPIVFLTAFALIFLESLLFQGLLFVADYIEAMMAIPIALLGIAVGALLVFGFRRQLKLTAGVVSVLLLHEVARAEARRLKVRLCGTLGILVRAYRQGLLSFDQVELLIREIAARPDIWIAARLCEQVLASLHRPGQQ